MAGIRYVYVPLENASLVQRRHDREVVPPGFVTLENFISSRSDNVPTLRPDIINDTSIKLMAYRTLLGDYSLSATDEYLNSAFGLYGGDNLIFLTTRFPIDNSTDVTLGTYSGVEYSTIISKLVDSGTATASVTNDSSYLVNSDSAEINLNQKAWYGACVKFDTDDRYFPIRTVTDKENCVLESPVDFTGATEAFKILQSHCPANTGYKFHTELFLSNSIYNTPIFDNPFSTQRMSGPFVGNITENVDYIEYTGEFTEFTEAQSTNFQNQRSDLTSEYNTEEFSRKFCASGNAIFMSVKPFYEKWEDVGDPAVSTLTHAGPYYTLTPDVTSSYLPPIEGGAGDIMALLPIATDYTEYYTRSFNRAEIIFDGTNKFYMPVVVYGADVGGGGPDYSVAIIEFADDATPTTTAHLTDYSIGAALPAGGFSFGNICYNSTDSTIWIHFSEYDNNTEGDEILVVSTADWTTSVETMPSVIAAYGMEFSATGDGVLVCGVLAADRNDPNSNVGIACFYTCTTNTWSTLTNPSADNYPYYGCGIYDDETSWVFTITGMSRLFYWGKEDASTIVNTGSEFSSDLASGAFRTASNGFVYDPTGTPIYSTVVILSGHDKVGVATVDAATSSVSFTKLVDGNFDEWGGTYIGKFQRPIFYLPTSEMFVCSHTVGVDTSDFSHGVSVVDAMPGTYVSYFVDEFTAISDLYRSKAFGIVSGYVVLFGLLEYDVNTDAWSYEPRRIRWTAPATVNDFTSDGSGTADVIGNGEFIDARTVNERIVMFETNAISTLVPRGIVDDPFDYEVIHYGIRAASNPCVVNDIIYFIASDGLIYSTNGVSVEELGASFDLTEFDDFDEKKPAWLVYSVELNSLLVFYPDSSISTVYCISLANGTVTSFNVYDYANNYPLKAIVSTESSSNIDTYFSYNPQPLGGTEEAVCSISVLDTDNEIDGNDTITGTAYTGSWYGEIETGNLFNEEFPEGIKIALKHIIVHTYSNTDVVTYNPDISIEVKSIEDSDWHGAQDTLADSAISVTSSTATISSSAPPTAFSYKLGTATGASVTYNIPWIAANCRVYTETGGTYTACTLVTTTPDAANEYQISGTKQIKVFGTAGHSVYCYCENEPYIRVKVGDYVENPTESLLRITAINSYISSTLYTTTFNGETAGSLVHAEQIPVGSGTVKIPINKLVEGVKLRIRVIPRTGGTQSPTIVKITGISLGYVPLGEKILEATGG